MEKEKENKIAFLDVEIIRKNKQLLMNWYTKSIASGRLINYHSNHPWKQKINTATSMIRKVALLSEKEYIEENMKKTKNILFKNCYPSTFIDRLINNTINRISQNPDNLPPDNTNKKYIGVTYIPGLTDNQILHKIINNKNINYAHKPNNTLNYIFTKIKDPIPKDQQNDVVYKITCNGRDDDKCGKWYIGTTKRQLGIRIYEHQKDAANKTTNTGLAHHLTKSNHIADFSNVEILDIEKREKTRMSLESIRIQQQISNTLNFKEYFDNISRKVYKTIRKDPTQQLMRKNNAIVNELFKENKINIREKFQLASTAAVAPRLYGLPKIHKESMPLRPISSSTRVPCCKLSKHIGAILKNIISEDFNIKNAFQLKERLKNINIEDDEVLISFDVISLFTNIPTHLAIQTIMKQWSQLEKHTNISRKQFQNILEFC
ncbi:uncharacterized protein [Eurosta solidaginis]|uniref:uncharacterized protein n=1 Tax=Eurosta solidaginis TaxID=178769 RepID=UPI0035314FA3